MPNLDHLYKVEDILEDMMDVFKPDSGLQKVTKEVVFTLRQVRLGTLSFYDATQKLQRMLDGTQDYMFSRDAEKQKQTVWKWHLLCTVFVLLEHFLGET